MKTQESEILRYLKKHRRIDPKTAWQQLGCYRLGARIFDLRRQGFNIATVMRYRGKTKWAEYQL